MSLSRFALALPVVLAAVPAFGQAYYYPQPTQQQPVYEDDPRYRPQPPRYADSAPVYPRRDPSYAPGYARPQPPYAQPDYARPYAQPYGYAPQPYPRRQAPAYDREERQPADPRDAYARDVAPQEDRTPGDQAYNPPAYQRPAPAPAYDAAPPAARRPEPAAAPEQVDRLEQMMWQAAAQADSASAYATYLNRYPGGDHAGEALASIERLRRMPAQAPRPVAPAPIVEPVPAAPVAASVAAVAAPAAAAPVAGGKPLPVVTVATAPVPVAPSETVEAAAPPAAAIAANAAVAGPAEAAAAQPAIAVASAGPLPPAPAPNAGVIPADLPAAVCRPAYAGDAPFDQAGEAEIAAYLRANQTNSIGAYEAYLQAWPRGAFAPEVAELIAARQGRMAALAKVPAAGAAAAHAQAQLVPGDRDYPSAALRDGQQGQATAIWEVAEDGCVEQCRIDRSSGSAALDAATCRMITSRGRYDPAFDAAGKPIRSLASATFAWKLPVH